MLRDAVTEDKIRHLPGWGKPIDLGDYFSTSEEYRQAMKILKDNRVLPQELQDLKQAEAALHRADMLRAEELESLKTMRWEIDAAAGCVVGVFASRDDAAAALGLSAWPEYFPDPSVISRAGPARIHHETAALGVRVKRYNARVNRLIHRYLDLLREARAATERYRNQSMVTRGLLAYSPTVRNIGIAECENEIRRSAPLLSPLAEDLTVHARAYVRAISTPRWRRFLPLVARLWPR